MADEPAGGGNSPRNTSEATPPHADDSPEMVSQPSPPEDERVTSSSDHPPPEKVDSPPGEPRVSSTSGQEVNVGAGPSNQEPGSGPSSPENASAVANQPSPDGPPDPVLRDILEAPFRPPPSTVQRVRQVSLEEVEAAVEASKLALAIKDSKDDQARSCQEVTKEADKKSDDSSQQFDVEDLSPGSKSSENVDLGSDSSPVEASVHGEEQCGSESSAKDKTEMEGVSSQRMDPVIETESSSGTSTKEDAGMKSVLSPSITTVEAESNPRIDVPENVAIKIESSASETGTRKDIGKDTPSSKSSLTVPGFQSCSTTDDVGSKKELSPSKSGTSSLQGSGSASGTTEKPRDNISPKRKSPTKVDHLSPKRIAPFTDSLQNQSESQISTILEELDIEGTKDNAGSSNPASEKEQKSMEVEESEENKKELTEQDDNMEVEETDSPKAEGETIEKDSKDSEKDDAE